MTEAAAINECQNGNLEAFTTLYDAYITPVYKFVFYKTSHRETAEDLTSAAFMKALEKIHSFDAQKASFKTWLYQIARNTVIDHYRQNHDTQDIEDAWGVDTKEDIVTDTDLKLKIETVHKHLQSLSADQREVVLLRVWGDHSFKEISEITGKTEAACKMNFKRSIEKLKGLMAILTLLYFLIH